MADARQREAWNHTASLLALLANCHRDPKRARSYTLADFHPCLDARPPRPPPPADLSILKAVFVDGHVPEHRP
jgi:hypothetical protein